MGRWCTHGTVSYPSMGQHNDRFLPGQMVPEVLSQKETAETTAAAVINDRRLYCIPQGDSMDLESGAVIYA